MDQLALATISWIPGIITAVASTVTASVAIAVFRETLRIRKLELVNQTNMIWNDFNAHLLNDDIRSVWLDFLNNDAVSYDEFKLDNKANWLVFSHLNILVTSIRSSELMGRTDAFFKNIIEAEFSQLWKRRDYVRQLMRVTSYDHKTQHYFEKYCVELDRLMETGISFDVALATIRNINWMKR
jgi:hypothetical protein